MAGGMPHSSLSAHHGLTQFIDAVLAYLRGLFSGFAIIIQLDS